MEEVESDGANVAFIWIWAKIEIVVHDARRAWGMRSCTRYIWLRAILETLCASSSYSFCTSGIPQNSH